MKSQNEKPLSATLLLYFPADASCVTATQISSSASTADSSFTQAACFAAAPAAAVHSLHSTPVWVRSAEDSVYSFLFLLRQVLFVQSDCNRLHRFEGIQGIGIHEAGR